MAIIATLLGSVRGWLQSPIPDARALLGTYEGPPLRHLVRQLVHRLAQACCLLRHFPQSRCERLGVVPLLLLACPVLLLARRGILEVILVILVLLVVLGVLGVLVLDVLAVLAV